MKKAEIHNVRYCDFCNNKAYYNCLNCGVDLCRNHRVIYPCSFYCEGSMDGTFCKVCDEKLKTQPTPLYNLYKTMEGLVAAKKAYIESLEDAANGIEQLIQQNRHENTPD